MVKIDLVFCRGFCWGYRLSVSCLGFRANGARVEDERLIFQGGRCESRSETSISQKVTTGTLLLCFLERNDNILPRATPRCVGPQREQVPGSALIQAVRGGGEADSKGCTD